ncbi:unnamed protein product [Peronospora effusa]|nr:unnamed protein product [Peronospora effusa]
MKRRGSPRIANSKKKKQTSCAEALMDSPAGRLGFILELEAGQSVPTWDASVTVTGYEVSTLNDLVWRSVLVPDRSL